MKKKLLILLGLALAAVFTLAACTTFIGYTDITPWTDVLANNPITDGTDENGNPIRVETETLEYRVYVDEAAYTEDSSSANYNPTINKNEPLLYPAPAEYAPEGVTDSTGAPVTHSFYRSVLSWNTNKADVFTLRTEFYFLGQFKLLNGEYVSAPFTDSIVTEAKFYRTQTHPITSARTVKNTVAYYNSETKAYETKLLHYRETSEYRSTKENFTQAEAKTTLNLWNEAEGAYNLPMPQNTQTPDGKGGGFRPQERTFKIDSPVRDRETLFYSVRAIKNTAETAMASGAFYFNMPNIAFGTVEKHALYSDEKELSKTLNIALGNGETVTKYAAYVMDMLTGTSQTGGTAGAVKMYYSTAKNGDGGSMSKYLLRMSQNAVVYDLQKVNGKYLTSDLSKEEESPSETA